MLSGEQLRKRRERVCGVSLSIGLRGDLIKQMVAGDRAKTAVNKPKPLGKSPHKARNLLGQIGDAGRTPRYSRRTRGAAARRSRHHVPSRPEALRDTARGGAASWFLVIMAGWVHNEWSLFTHSSARGEGLPSHPWRLLERNVLRVY